MLKVTSVLGQENYLIIPLSLYEKWALADTEYLYALIKNKRILITKDARRNARQMKLLRQDQLTRSFEGTAPVQEFGICLPRYMVAALKLGVESELLLTLENNEVMIGPSNVIQLQSPERNAVRLEENLTNEFEAIKANKYGIQAYAFFEDVYMFLLLGRFDSTTVENLLSSPTPIQDLITQLRDDDEFNDFFEKKLLELIAKKIN